MTFQLVTGPALSATCQGCRKHLTAGSEPYRSASTGLLDGQPDVVYADLAGTPFLAYYCHSCARKHSEFPDPTLSRSQFYSNTSGEAIL